VETVYEAIEHQDVLACAFARLLLWTSPRALPTSEQPDHGWREYLATWRPGKPRESEWAGNFGRGWDVTRMVRA
jgi:hypothetical protein